MKEENLTIEQIDVRLLEIDEKINEIKNKPYSLTTLNMESDLNKERRHLEALKFDLIHGTHKVQIRALDAELSKLSMALFSAKTKYVRSDEFNLKANKESLDRVQSNVDALQREISALEELDKQILLDEANGKSL